MEFLYVLRSAWIAEHSADFPNHGARERYPQAPQPTPFGHK